MNKTTQKAAAFTSSLFPSNIILVTCLIFVKSLDRCLAMKTLCVCITIVFTTLQTVEVTRKCTTEKGIFSKVLLLEKNFFSFAPAKLHKTKS